MQNKFDPRYNSKLISLLTELYGAKAAKFDDRAAIIGKLHSTKGMDKKAFQKGNLNEGKKD